MKLSGAYTIAVATMVAGIYSASVDTDADVSDEGASADPPVPSFRSAVLSLDMPEVAFGAAVREEARFEGSPGALRAVLTEAPTMQARPAALALALPEITINPAELELPRVDGPSVALHSVQAEAPAHPVQPAALALALPDVAMGAAELDAPHFDGPPAAVRTILARAPVSHAGNFALALDMPEVAVGTAKLEVPRFDGPPAALRAVLAEAPMSPVQPAALALEVPEVAVGTGELEAPRFDGPPAALRAVLAEAPMSPVQPTALALELPEVSMGAAELEAPRFDGPPEVLRATLAQAPVTPVQPASFAVNKPEVAMGAPETTAPRNAAMSMVRNSVLAETQTPVGRSAMQAEATTPVAQSRLFAVELPEVAFGAALRDHLRLSDTPTATESLPVGDAGQASAGPATQAPPSGGAILASRDPSQIVKAESSDEIEALRQEVRAVKAREAAALHRVEELEKLASRLEALADRLAVFDPVSPGESASLRGTYLPTARPSVPDSSLAFFQEERRPSVDSYGSTGGGESTDKDLNLPAEEEEEVRKAPAPTQAVEDVVSEQQGNFNRRVSFDLDAGYSHFGKSRINLSGFLALDSIFLGTISVDKVTSDIFTLSPTVRVGLTKRLALDANIPYLMRQTNYQSGGAGGSASGLIEETVKEEGFGDLSVGMSYRVLPETTGQPDVVLNARMKFPTGRDPYGIPLEVVPNSEENLQVPVHLSTGTGVYSAAFGVSLLKTLDPMVVFGSVNYFHNFRRKFGDINEQPGEQPGRVDVGDAVQFGAGLAFALNERSSISMSYSQRIVQHSKIKSIGGQSWQTVAGSQGNVALVNLGATFSLGDNVSLRANVGIGLTDDSPDMSVGIGLPIRF